MFTICMWDVCDCECSARSVYRWHSNRTFHKRRKGSHWHWNVRWNVNRRRIYSRSRLTWNVYHPQYSPTTKKPKHQSRPNQHRFSHETQTTYSESPSHVNINKYACGSSCRWVIGKLYSELGELRWKDKEIITQQKTSKYLPTGQKPPEWRAKKLRLECAWKKVRGGKAVGRAEQMCNRCVWSLNGWLVGGLVQTMRVAQDRCNFQIEYFYLVRLTGSHFRFVI